MKKCKFCKQQGRQSKRTIVLPIGLEVTSLDPMCAQCYNKIKQINEQSNITSGNTHIVEVEGTGKRAPTIEG